MKKYELPDDFYKLSNEQLNAEIRKLKEVNRSRIRRLASRPTLSRYTQNFIPKINLAKATREEKEHVAKQLIAQLNAPELLKRINIHLFPEVATRKPKKIAFFPVFLSEPLKNYRKWAFPDLRCLRL